MQAMVSVCKTYTFAAAHYLPHHQGKCHELHGHNYRVEVEVQGDLHFSGPESGMVLDFDNLDDAVEPLIGQLDHKLLNAAILDIESPTAENLAVWLATELWSKLGNAIARVRVWETDKCWAEVKNA